MSTTFKDFIAFVQSAPSGTPLDHTDCFNGCAVGLFAESLDISPSVAWADITGTQPEMAPVQFPGHVFYHDFGVVSDMATLIDIIDDTHLMPVIAPTMGGLVKLIQNHFPSVLETTAKDE